MVTSVLFDGTGTAVAAERGCEHRTVTGNDTLHDRGRSWACWRCEWADIPAAALYGQVADAVRPGDRDCVQRECDVSRGNGGGALAWCRGGGASGLYVFACHRL